MVLISRSPKFVFLIPANTLAPITQVFRLGKGQCKQITILIPTGHSRLTTLQIVRHGRILFPEPVIGTGQTETYIGDGTQYTVITDFTCTGGDDQIVMNGTNTDDTYQHRFIVQFEMQDLPEDFFAVNNPLPSYGKIDFTKYWDVFNSDFYGKRR